MQHYVHQLVTIFVCLLFGAVQVVWFKVNMNQTNSDRLDTNVTLKHTQGQASQNRRHQVTNQSTCLWDLFHRDWFKTTSLMHYWPASHSLQIDWQAVGKLGKIVTRDEQTGVLLALIVVSILFSPHFGTLLFIMRLSPKCHSFQFIAVLFWAWF